MAKDLTDYVTVDCLPPEVKVTCGQVLMDRQRHIAVIAKKGRTCAYLVQVKSGVLKLRKYTLNELVEQWSDVEYPFDQAVAKLLDLGHRHGITDAARSALDELMKIGREPRQSRLFS